MFSMQQLFMFCAGVAYMHHIVHSYSPLKIQTLLHTVFALNVLGEV